MQTVIGSFDDLARAQNAATAIMNTGMVADDLELMYMEDDDHIVTAELLGVDDASVERSPVEPALEFGAGIPVAVPNTVAAASPNLLSGQGSFSNPGVAPALAVDALAKQFRPRTAVAHHSADPRSMSQALSEESVPEPFIDRLSDRLRAGHVLLITHVAPEQVPLVTNLLRTHGSQDVLPDEDSIQELTDTERPSFKTDLVAPTEGTTSATSDRQYAAAPRILGSPAEASGQQPFGEPEATDATTAPGAAVDGASASSNAAHSVEASQPAGPSVSGASNDNPLIAGDLLGDTNAGTHPPARVVDATHNDVADYHEDLEDNFDRSSREAAGAGSGF